MCFLPLVSLTAFIELVGVLCGVGADEHQYSLGGPQIGRTTTGVVDDAGHGATHALEGSLRAGRECVMV